MDPKTLNQQTAQDLEDIHNLLSQLHSDVSTLEAAYSEVLHVLRRFDHLAHTDELTGLLRRNAFFGRWHELLERCRQANENSGVLLIDVDHFKKVNDTHGHAAGDEVLQRLGDLLKGFESSEVVVGRLGGEEFVVAAKGSEHKLQFMAEQIRRHAERIPDELSTSPQSGEKPAVSVSIGVASVSEAGRTDPHELLAQADARLYKAKRSGRNRVTAA